MIHNVVAVRDSAMGSYARPFVVPTVPIAVRSFTDEVNRVSAENQMNAHADDFELWEIALWNDESGLFGNLEGGPRCIVRGKDVKKEVV